MKRIHVTLAAVVLIAAALGGCGFIEGLFNPFAGRWKSGITEIEFTGGGKFELKVGRAISLNLDGDYTYDEKNLFLSFGGGEPLKLSYEFGDDKKTLVLDPLTDSDYIKTRLKFAKQ
jgi:hypothetical protein